MSGFPKELWTEIKSRLEEAPEEDKAFWKMCRVFCREMEKSKTLLDAIRCQARFILDLEQAGYKDCASDLKDWLVEMCAK